MGRIKCLTNCVGRGDCFKKVVFEGNHHSSALLSDASEQLSPLDLTEPPRAFRIVYSMVQTSYFAE